MMFFSRRRKPSEEGRKRLEYQMCLTREAGADDILDISRCELSEIPPGVFSTFKVLQKKVLIVHTNYLSTLVPKLSNIQDLAMVKILDLHDNQLSSLPEELGQLSSLQVLQVENNHLKSLPNSIGSLHQLQTLNLKGNRIKKLPELLSGLKSLRTLDCSHNQIQQLPQDLAHIRTLESLSLDEEIMVYPPSSVCRGGTEAIKQFLCQELGIDYIPPSQYLLSVLESDGSTMETNGAFLQQQQEDSQWQSKFMDYEKRKVQKQQEKLEFERRLNQDQRERAELMQSNNVHKAQILNSIRQEQGKLDRDLRDQQRSVELGRRRLQQELKEAEYTVDNVIHSLLEDSERRKQNSELLNSLEIERLRVKQLMEITQEENEKLRKKEVAGAMQAMLSESNLNRLLQTVYETQRQCLIEEACSSMAEIDGKLQKIQTWQQEDQSKAIGQILAEAEMQKVAFETLQMKKDGEHTRIRDQIKLIESELMQLTKIELDRREVDLEDLQETLAEQRQALSDLLQQLLKEKRQREKELGDLLLEMETKHETNQENYWLIQYQRLMDQKPLSLRAREEGVEKELVDLLVDLSADRYLPLFAHHRITLKMLRYMTPADLQQIGIIEGRLQRAILRLAQEGARPEPTVLPVSAKGSAPEVQPSAPAEIQPSAPAEEEGEAGPSSPLLKVSRAVVAQSECVVCLERESQMIFLPCGHVCCCQPCAVVLRTCPLCRAGIEQKIRMYRTS
ncbi:E3 ubiquitin-protein ligase LRSAM1 [Callorhinchus milii]|uniref:E3 ubiquitin-protein ligase LRSAM1 n=1 Tax=Callorhinchus milii TaxID=7868 RepID=UPI001C3F5DD1|nr:E3 ubiquitin-protein ligase LRSAM1 [Callorhinchus milii]